MTSRVAHRRWPVVRLAAAALAGAGLLGCYLFHAVPPAGAVLLVFGLVVGLCGALVLLTRGLGPRVGTVLGLGIGLVAALGLAGDARAPVGNIITFVAVAMGVAGFLGRVAGTWPDAGGPGRVPAPQTPAQARREDSKPQRFPAGACTVPPAAAQRAGEACSTTAPADSILSAIAADFCRWLERGTGRQRHADGPSWATFDEFLCTLLQDRLGASGVRAWAVSTDGQQLQSLADDGGATSTSLGELPERVAAVVRSGRVYVAEPSDAAAGSPPNPSADGEAPRGAALAQPWAWLLPLQIDGRPRALVAAARVDHPHGRTLALAEAVRHQLQLLWSHMSVLRALVSQMRTDAPSGMLNRIELLAQLEQLVRESVREQEPVLVLALAIEGMRRLDDTGRWDDRDSLVERLAWVLRHKVRSDDLLGRFADDKFVIVLRRVDAELGAVVVEKLIHAVRAVVTELSSSEAFPAPAAHPVDGAPRLRAGLAGLDTNVGGRGSSGPLSLAETRGPIAESAATGVTLEDGRTLLERALGLLEYARLQRIEVATDQMKGLPERLTRGGWSSGPAERTPGVPVDTLAAASRPNRSAS